MNRAHGATLLVGAVLILLAAPAMADEVHLLDGRVIRGEIDVQPDGSVIVRQSYGTVTVPAEEIDAVVRDSSVAGEYRARLGRVDAASPESWVALAVWCSERDRAAEAREALERAVALDPDHAVARRLLGFVRYQGAWVAEADLRAQGLVPYRGEWIPADEARARREAAEAQRDLEEQLALARREADRERRRAERLERELAQARTDRRGGLAGSGLPTPPPTEPQPGREWSDPYRRSALYDALVWAMVERQRREAACHPHHGLVPAFGLDVDIPLGRDSNLRIRLGD